MTGKNLKRSLEGKLMVNSIVKWRKKLLSPIKGSEWASEMVLNPALVTDPETSKIHMLFRATGPYSGARIPGKPMPYPIFLGYGFSENGFDFQFDLERPALSPELCFEKDKIHIINEKGQRLVNYANGCIEDPRLQFIDGACYMTVACRMFPPGPYWENDDSVQCMPEWAKEGDNPYGTQRNPTVNVLYRVNLQALERGEYEDAFKYVTHLTNPHYGEDRDVVFFSKRMMVKGELCYIMLHRPVCPQNYDGITETRPSIFIAAAKEFSDFAVDRCVDRKMIMVPTQDWQENRIGASAPPIEVGDGYWLLNYHGKQNDEVGYGQSFMMFKEQENSLPVIDQVCDEKLIAVGEDFERPSKFKTPCVFFTGMIQQEGDLLISYGAADEHVGIMKVDYQQLMHIFGK